MSQPVFDNIEKYKYRLREGYSFRLPGTTPEVKKTDRIPEWLRYDNEAKVLQFRVGYCWNGSSGPTMDSNSCYRASLVHDGAYQLLREGVFGEGEDLKKARLYFDALYLGMCIEDGMSPWKAQTRYRALRLFGGFVI